MLRKRIAVRLRQAADYIEDPPRRLTRAEFDEAMAEVMRYGAVPPLRAVPSESTSQRALLLIRATATHFDVPMGMVMGRDRTPLVAVARQVAMAVVRSKTGLSLPAIGRIFHRDHSTVLHGVRRVAADAELRRACEEISHSAEPDIAAI